MQRISMRIGLVALVTTISVNSVIAQEFTQQLRQSLVFHAPFDGTGDAKRFQRDGKIFTAESLARKQRTPGMVRPNVELSKGNGRYGDCLRFTDKSKEVLCFDGTEMPYSSSDWSTTISFWMRLNPDKDLKPGYCDPIQVTQKAWNDAAIFVDFDKDLPRDFRLGVFSDLKYWNPQNVPWEKWPVAQRPMVTVKQPSFSSSTWTHVALALDHVNAASDVAGTATLFMNGKSQGTMKRTMKFTWEPSQTAIMLGIEYIGDFDDLMIFNRALTDAEVLALSQLPETL